MLRAIPRSRRTIAIGTVLAVALATPCLSARADGELPGGKAPGSEPIDDRRFSWLRRPGAWETRWSRPITAAAPAVVAGLVAWNHGGAVHAVRIADGRPAWRSVPPHDTLFFPRPIGSPRSAGPRPAVASSPRPADVAAVGHLLYAVIDAEPTGSLLICLDCSNTAEGRLLWSAAPPDGCDGFEGSPVADHDLCAVVVHRVAGRGPLEVVAHDARDGVVLWRRPLRTLGTSLARDSLDHARGMPATTRAEELVVVADVAGSVWALDRAGRFAWQTATHEPLRIVGLAAGSVVVEFRSAMKRGALAALSAVDGRLLATGGAGETACGPAVLAGGAILQPSRAAADGRLSITSLDPVTMQPLGDPFRMAVAPRDAAPGGSADDRVHMAVAPRTLVVAEPRQFSCLGVAP